MLEIMPVVEPREIEKKGKEMTARRFYPCCVDAC
jgi:hypothetical protein